MKHDRNQINSTTTYTKLRQLTHSVDIHTQHSKLKQ